MNKITLLCGCLLACFATSAQPMLPNQKTDSRPSLQSLELNARCVNSPLNVMTTRAEEPIYEAPEGEKVLYERTSYGYYYEWDTLQFGKREGGISIVYTEDGEAYIRNPVAGWGTNTYLRGTMTDEGIEVTLPQLIDVEPDFENIGGTILFYAAVMKCVDSSDDYVTYEVVEENVTFLIDDEGNISFNLSGNDQTPNKDIIMGLCDDQGRLFFGDAAQYLTKVNLSNITPPEGLELEDWQFYAYGEPHSIKVGFDGEDIYLRNFDYVYTPRTWIKGKIDGDNVTFESGQFLAEEYGYFYYFLAATLENNLYAIEPSITFQYSREKNMMTVPEGQCMVSNPRLSSISNTYPDYMPYEDPVIKKSGFISSYVPANPKFIGFVDFFFEMGMNYCEFHLYPYSEDYDPIDTSQLSFRLYINDEMVDNFSPGSNMTDFPYGFWGEDPNLMTIFQLGTNLVMYLYDRNIKSIGVQLINTTPEGEEFESALVIYDVTTDSVIIDQEDGVEMLLGDDVVSSEYYDLNGLRCDPTSKGLHIIVERHSDGSITSRKVMRR